VDAGPAAGEIQQAIETAAHRHDAGIAALHVFDLDGLPVVRLRLRSDDPARFLARQLRLVLAAMGDVAYRYAEVVDAAGTRITLGGRVQGGGMSWTDRRFESCSPFQGLSRAIDYRPIPCPFAGASVLARPGALPTRRVAEVEALAAPEAEAGETVITLTVGPDAREVSNALRIKDFPGADGTVWFAALSFPDAGRSAGWPSTIAPAGCSTARSARESTGSGSAARCYC
jgi:hypothetical protein